MAPPLSLPPLEPLEIHSGVILGPRRGSLPPHDPSPGRRPGVRQALEELVRSALVRRPCMVGFSGGRDSSAILALATDVARREGLEDPIPLTFRYPGHPRTWETEWQELVVRHLQLTDWKIVDFQSEFDVLGSMARQSLRRHGLFWPPNAHTRIPMLEVASGGALLSGNGGDEVFNSVLKPRRMTRAEIIRSLPLSRGLMTVLVTSLPLRWKLRAQYRHGLRFPWLRRAARREVRRRFIENAIQVQRGGDYLERLSGSRYLELQEAIRSALAQDANADLVEPFFEPRFLRALLAETPASGFPSRSAAMEHFFGDLLPVELTRRTSKAVFTEAFWGPDSQGFARRWDGTGLDTTLVDPEALRSHWLRPRPDLRSATALQAAWQASPEARGGNSNDFHT